MEPFVIPLHVPDRGSSARIRLYPLVPCLGSRKSELLSKFLEQVLQLTQMPSKRMAANLIQAWQTFANKPNAKDMPAFVVLVPQLLAAFASHSVVVSSSFHAFYPFVALFVSTKK